MPLPMNYQWDFACPIFLKWGDLDTAISLNANKVFFIA